MEFNWTNSVISGRCSYASISEEEQKKFKIKKTENDDSRYRITWIIQSKINKKFKPLNESNALSLLEKDDRGAFKETPQDNKTSTVSFKITNNTSYDFELYDRTLEIGKWKLEPPLNILTNQTFDFSCDTNFAGLSGWLVYKSESGNARLIITWRFPIQEPYEVLATFPGIQKHFIQCETKIVKKENLTFVNFNLYVESNSISITKPEIKNYMGFKISISLILEREKRQSHIPYVIQTIFDFITTNHLINPDIFVKSGTFSDSIKLRTFIESGIILDLAKFNPYSVVYILKSFLRELPEPLIPYGRLSKFDISGFKNSKSSIIHYFSNFLDKIPKDNLPTLMYILKNLYKFWTSKNSPHTSDQLALIFSPLICPEKTNSSLIIPNFIAINTLIQNFDQIQ